MPYLIFYILFVLGLTSLPELHCQKPAAEPDDLTKIIGGRDVEIEQYPFMVFVFRERGDTILRCGGTLIRPEWVLTAAHCVINKQNPKGNTLPKAKKFTVIAGRTLMHADIDESEIVRSVIKLHVNKYYDPELVIEDIALLELSSAFDTRSENIQLVTLPKPSSYNDMKPTICTAVGWGKTSRKEKRSANLNDATYYNGIERSSGLGHQLKAVELKIVNTKKCQKEWGEWFARPIYEDRQICLEDQRMAATAQGDSGGPILCGEYEMAIVSYGDGSNDSATHYNPSVYTRVDFYLDWINATISSARALRATQRSAWVTQFCATHAFLAVLSHVSQ